MSLCLYNGGQTSATSTCLTRPTHVLAGLTCSAPPSAVPPSDPCAVNVIVALDPGQSLGSLSWGLIIDLSTADGR